MRALFVIVLVLLVAGSLPLRGEEAEAAARASREAREEPGYIDADRDGANDLFRDADGDGIDDVSGKPYPHRFSFVDQDRDGRNDVFADQDGDGVNDRSGRYVDRDRDGICDNVIDFDGNGVNDITGLKYTRKSLQGYRYGRVDEERRRVHRRFRDRDGDGMHDVLQRFAGPDLGFNRKFDYFIDEDGDGIGDGRVLGPRRPPPLPRHLPTGPPPPRQPGPQHQKGHRR